MEIKYTLEILTKDIQDIENLVSKLQNSAGDSTLEIDLALSKLRNVYDVLSTIRTDMDELRKHPSEAPSPVTDRATVPEAKENIIVEPEPSREPATEEEEHREEELPVSESGEGDGKSKAMKTRGNAEILAEKFLAQASINENLATSRKPDVDSRVKGKPIDNISRNIGINDRFLIIRELFGGNAEEFRNMIEQLDQAGSLEPAMDLIGHRFPGEEKHDGVRILSDLVKRRYANN